MIEDRIFTMRDALIGGIYERMETNDSLFFVSADMGAPVLDKLRSDYPDRFLNVGIAEQNLINVSTGLAIEGFTVYAYAIAPFITMRAFEQVRTNLSLSARFRELNVNLIGVGAGVSYDMSGPTHHSVEDISIMRTLPDIALVSPADWVTAGAFLDYSIDNTGPKYMRLDGKPLPAVYSDEEEFDWSIGFKELRSGTDLCIISTGYMTRKAEEAAIAMEAVGVDIGVVDLFLLKPFNETALFDRVKGYKNIITLEEGFIDKGGLDSMILGMISERDLDIKLKRLGFFDSYLFKTGGRERLYSMSGFGAKEIIAEIRAMLDGNT